MSSWPTSPIIRITCGDLYGRVPLHGALAARVGMGAEGADFKYQIIEGPGAGRILRRDSPGTGRICAWEGILPVPTSDVAGLRDNLCGAPLSERQLAPILKITSLLKSVKPSPLDRAVSRVEGLLRGPRTLLDTSSERYLALVLRSLATLQEVEGEGPREAEVLYTLVRLCVEWVAEIAPSQFPGEEGVLAEVRGRVESDPVPGNFAVMTSVAGEAAALIDSVDTGELAGQVLTIAHYALASAAKNFKDGE